MTLTSQIHPEIIVLPEYPGQNTKVVQDFFGDRKVCEAEAAQKMKKHRKKETAAEKAKDTLAKWGKEGKALVEGQAASLRKYWAEQGYDINVTIESNGYDENNRTLWKIRTDLKNGLPKNYKGPRT